MSVAGAILALALAPALTGCYAMRPSAGAGQTTFEPPRVVEPADVALPAGYRIEPVATGLTFPTGVAFDGAGAIYVTESGYSYGEVWTTSRLLRIEPDGSSAVIAEGGGSGPWNGVAWHGGAFYVAAGGVREGGGAVLRIGHAGDIAAIAGPLPSHGDHHTNGPVAGPDGWIYFSIGTATNSGVVGVDNADGGWLRRYPGFHDVPCQDVTLAGRNYPSADPFGSGQAVATGAFVPFGTPTREGQLVPGRIPCSGAILRTRPEGGPPELVAWGLRNPFGLAFAPDGRLFATDNSYDTRGSRHVFGAGDLLWQIEPGAWYGWPDFHGQRRLDDGDRYRPPGQPAPEPVLAEYPASPPRPAAILGVHASANGFDFSRSPAFGRLGQAFVAQFGDLAPETGKVLSPVGAKVVQVDIDTGVIEDFAVNVGPTQAPASRLGSGGLERPVAARFDPSGTALYVVDFGVLTVEDGAYVPRPETGVLWRITRDAAGG